MPLQRLDVAAVVELAARLGIRLTATEAEIFRTRIEDHVEAMEAFIELRIDEDRPPLRHTRRDPGYRPTEAEDPLNAFIRKCRVEGAADGPLAGRTVGLKDHTALAGVPLSLGSHFMEGYVPDFDATVVTRLLDAGATVVGKMNMEDFSFGGPGFSGVGDFGRPLNPHDHGYVTGGSSSGCGAAVAGGLVDIGIGGDQGGSIRIPAAWCGCIGLKATFGLIPHTGVVGLESTVDYVGPMTRTVEDLAAVLDCIAGRDGYDPRQAHLPDTLPDYSAELGRDLDGLRIGVLEEGFDVAGGEADVYEAVHEALAVLERAGVRLERISVPAHRIATQAIVQLFVEGTKLTYDTNLAGAFTHGFYPSSLMATFGRAKRSHSHELPLNYLLNLLSGAYAQERFNGRLYAKAQNVRATITRGYLEAFERVDVLALPTVVAKSHPYREPTDWTDAFDRTLFGGERGENIGMLLENAAPFNYTGFPALSLPCAKSQGMPVGLQLVGANYREDLLVRVAHRFQESVDWAGLMPD